MKTFRQELRNWLKDKKNSSKSSEENNLLEEILVKINELESVEADNINRAYQKGHIDSEKGKNPLSNYYRTTHKTTSQLKSMIKN